MSGFGNIEDELSKLSGKDYPLGYFEPRCEAFPFSSEHLAIKFRYGDGRRIFHPELLVVTELGVIPRSRFAHLDKVAESLWEVFAARREPECHDWLSGGVINRHIREGFGRHGVRYVVHLESTYDNHKAVFICSVTEKTIISLGGTPGFVLPKRKNLDMNADVVQGTLTTLAYKLKNALSSYVTN